MWIAAAPVELFSELGATLSEKLKALDIGAHQWLARLLADQQSQSIMATQTINYFINI